MKKLILLVILLIGVNLHAQIIVQGYVFDNSSNETLIGATLIASNGTGTVTDFNGFYQLSLPEGKHELSISYVGYEALKKTITLYKKTENHRKQKTAYNTLKSFKKHSKNPKNLKNIKNCIKPKTTNITIIKTVKKCKALKTLKILKMLNSIKKR